MNNQTVVIETPKEVLVTVYGGIGPKGDDGDGGGGAVSDSGVFIMEVTTSFIGAFGIPLVIKNTTGLDFTFVDRSQEAQGMYQITPSSLVGKYFWCEVMLPKDYENYLYYDRLAGEIMGVSMFVSPVQIKITVYNI